MTEENTTYPVQFLKDAIEEIDEREGSQVRVHYRKLDEFVENHGRVFLFGTGDYGRRMKAYCDYKGIAVAGFLTSNQEDSSKRVYRLDSFRFLPDDGIILSLMDKNAVQVFPAAEKRVGSENVYLLEYHELSNG